MRLRRALAALPLAGFVLVGSAGCVSSTDVAAQSDQVRIAPPIADAARVCPPLTGAELSEILATPFPAQPTVVASDAEVSECRFVSTNREAFVITKTYRRDPATQFKQSLADVQRNLGATTEINVKGTKAAYAVPAVGRYGLLTDDAYTEVNLVVPGLSLVEVAEVLRATRCSSSSPTAGATRSSSSGFAGSHLVPFA